MRLWKIFATRCIAPGDWILLETHVPPIKRMGEDGSHCIVTGEGNPDVDPCVWTKKDGVWDLDEALTRRAFGEHTLADVTDDLWKELRVAQRHYEWLLHSDAVEPTARVEIEKRVQTMGRVLRKASTIFGNGHDEGENG